MKLDMSKAYDRVEWPFVEEIIKKLGFDLEWVVSLMKCVKTVSYKVGLNGYIGEKIYPSRGLRQGDPLSPFLFLFYGEGLSSLMKLAMQRKTIRGVKARNSPLLTWKSVWSAKGSLEKGLFWRVGKGDSISVWKDLWANIARRNMKIPLARPVYDDFQVWRGEPSVWKNSWDFIPTFSNLKLKRVAIDDRCPKCQHNGEDSNHVFRQCPTTIEVWRNTLIYERKNTTGRDISKKIYSYILELKGIEEKKLILEEGRKTEHDEQRMSVAIYFDVAFDQQFFNSASGLIVRDVGGNILASKSVLHSDVASPFAAEAHAAKEALKKGEEQYLEGDIPSSVRFAIEKKRLGIAN
ncbi:hypothetical protein PVK06_016330 [Gossypium arboreum]|uniref:Reverse transcriptase domain-containing protein n=1 Tax=Gossypium arboreum TaxID=29729 RepID=A0ABR0PZS2_GOSAR|nr:hypothetical protein PVK06_016330 [Gossypium arboreum]